MSTVTVEELRRQIEAEMAEHKTAMDSIAEETRKFKSLLDDGQQAFTDLITRVTNLRVAKGEYLAARAVERTQQYSACTGSDLLDSLLYAIQAKLDSPDASVGASVLQSLEGAALEAMTPYGERCVSALFTSNAAAVRQTGVLLRFSNDVRGVRAWAKRHFSSCPSCAARLAQLPPWTPDCYDSNATGFAAAPNLRSIPDKRYHQLACSLLQERSMAHRLDTEERLDLARGTFYLNLQSSEAGQPLADAAHICAAVTDALQVFLTESMNGLRDTARTAAPWNVGTTANSEVSAAMEILLHMIEPQVQVQAVPQPATTRHGALCTLVQVSAAVSVPLQVSAVAPLLRVLQVPEQRRHFTETVLTPLVLKVGDALGAGEMASHYTSVGLKFAESLYGLAEKFGLVPGVQSPPSSAAADVAAAGCSSSVGAAKLSQLYFVLQALAVFNTTVKVEMATPHLPADASDSSQKLKKSVLFLARSVLQRFSPPKPLNVPPASDPDLSELTIRISRAPTSFLEILNRTFSSSQRMPSTSRSSKLDTFLSLRSKISLGLKLFSELVVDVCRPYHPLTGVVLASENGLNGRSRVPACAPVADLPVDLVTANVKVATYVMKRLEDLQRCESALSAAQEETTVEKAGKEALQQAAGRLRSAPAVDRLHARWEELHVRVVEWSKAYVDVVLPFSMGEVDVCNATKPLLYLRVSYEC
ncbi:hypothetical protein ABL78_6213 [Leptomonas seymouri]|uniref:Uncharacterized protein n=1 Tax=Leptomonas seymouri TaxID=5684 RepID=A0A0N1PCZ9_LEPSE|nr:hypothetical protein ABL78_6213 [Leptomonas seymouri]|eukprot:KPI84720.1 hypothetical protein ABL78_6213 [Leptomonas seymouri]